MQKRKIMKPSSLFSMKKRTDQDRKRGTTGHVEIDYTLKSIRLRDPDQQKQGNKAKANIFDTTA
jgi:hypothetical protein